MNAIWILLLVFGGGLTVALVLLLAAIVALEYVQGKASYRYRG